MSNPCSDVVRQAIQLTDKELSAYCAWAEEMQLAAVKEGGESLGGMIISFEMSPLGVRIIAHINGCEETGPHIVLRE